MWSSGIAAASLRRADRRRAAHRLRRRGRDRGHQRLCAHRDERGSGYSPTFTGNGELECASRRRVRATPAAPCRPSSELAGFYANLPQGKPSKLVQQRANTPDVVDAHVRRWARRVGDPIRRRNPATLTTRSARVSGPAARRVGRLTVVWGRQWPEPRPNVRPARRAVKILRATSYSLQVSRDGHHWRTVARVNGRSRGAARYVRLPARPSTLRPPAHHAGVEQEGPTDGSGTDADGLTARHARSGCGRRLG